MSEELKKTEEIEEKEKSPSSDPLQKVKETVTKVNGETKKPIVKKEVKEKVLEEPKLVVSKEVQPKGGRKRGRPKKAKPTQLMTGSQLLFYTDVLIPRLIALGYNNFAGKGKEIDWKELQLTAAEKKELQQVSNEAAEMIGMQTDPLTTYGVTLAGIYIMKTLMQ